MDRWTDRQNDGLAILAHGAESNENNIAVSIPVATLLIRLHYSKLTYLWNFYIVWLSLEYRKVVIGII